jgi:hypothetical protein
VDESQSWCVRSCLRSRSYSDSKSEIRLIFRLIDSSMSSWLFLPPSPSRLVVELLVRLAYLTAGSYGLFEGAGATASVLLAAFFLLFNRFSARARDRADAKREQRNNRLPSALDTYHHYCRKASIRRRPPAVTHQLRPYHDQAEAIFDSVKSRENATKSIPTSLPPP